MSKESNVLQVAVKITELLYKENEGSYTFICANEDGDTVEVKMGTKSFNQDTQAFEDDADRKIKTENNLELLFGTRKPKEADVQDKDMVVYFNEGRNGLVPSFFEMIPFFQGMKFTDFKFKLDKSYKGKIININYREEYGLEVGIELLPDKSLVNYENPEDPILIKKSFSFANYNQATKEWSKDMLKRANFTNTLVNKAKLPVTAMKLGEFDPVAKLIEYKNEDFESLIGCECEIQFKKMSNPKFGDYYTAINDVDADGLY